MSFLLHGKSPHLAVINHFLDLQHFCPFLIIGVLFNALNPPDVFFVMIFCCCQGLAR